MPSTFSVFVWTLLNVHLVSGLSCYICGPISDPGTCTQTITCNDGDRCIFLNNGGNITLGGCTNDYTCSLIQPLSSSIIGRRDSYGTPSYCCDRDLCNNGQSLTTTVKTPEVCVDLNHAFCSSTSVHDTICSDPDLSVNWCRKTCGKCPTTTTTTTTTAVPCVDNQPDLCSAPGAETVFCSSLDRAVKYCQKTCNKCDVHSHQISPMMTTHKTTTTTRKTTPKPNTTTPKPTTTTPIPTTTTSTTTTTTTTSPPWICEDYDVAHCSDPDVNTVVCSDENLVYLCRKTCNRCEVNT
uniref:Zinc metalloproteinase nas-14-like n=1 Tax=Crassostrea virginica TaxID=6565 RepID=A0A8B8DEC0_CRAVI|nr:zinc metalloproteinase nas-14-like [Crassostrea virginica]